MDKHNSQFQKIIVFGDKLSDKTSLLNTLASNQIFEETFDDEANFKSQMVTINKEEFALFDSISFNSCSKTSSLKRKISSFIDNISTEFKLVLVALSITNYPSNLEAIKLFLKMFRFTRMKNVFFILTQGDLCNRKDERDEKYLNIEEDLRSLFISNDLKSETLRVHYLDEDNKEEMKKELLSIAVEKEEYCNIVTDRDIDNIINVFAKTSYEEEVTENKDSLWTVFKRFVNSNFMLNNANIML